MTERLMCVVCRSTREDHNKGCPVAEDMTGQVFAYAQPLGYIDVHSPDPSSGLTIIASQWVGGVEQKFPTRVQVYKCTRCGAVLLAQSTGKHQSDHATNDAALVELQLRTDRRPPDKRRIKYIDKGANSGQEGKS